MAAKIKKDDAHYINLKSNTGKEFISESNDAKTWYQKAVNHYKRDQLDDSEFCYKQTIKFNPYLKEAYNNLAIVLLFKKEYEEALKYLKIVINEQPEYIDPYINMGIVFEYQHRYNQAERCYLKALEIDPFSLEANLNLGKIYDLDFKLDQSLSCYLNALKKEPNNPILHLNIGNVCHKKMELEKSLHHYKLAMNNNLNAKIHYHLALPIIYRTEKEIDRYRDRFAKGLQIIDGETKAVSSDNLRQYVNMIKNYSPFYLQYQGKDDTNLQKKYGALVYRIMAANFPQWVGKKKMPPLSAGEKIRIGYVSSYMQSHSVGKFIIGWYRYHNRNQVRVYSYYINYKIDALTNDYRQNSDEFHHIPNNVEMAARQILKDNLHVLIFTDIGMFPPATMLAALRLAPIQCVTWGHPVTTGLPTIDYFLSSDLMEPKDGQNHYSEQLIRLPNLGLAQKEDILPKNPKQRADFNLPHAAFIYLSSQSLYKYLPQYDHVFPEIAKRVSDSLFVFIAHSSAYVTKAFLERISSVFSFYGLRYENFCKIIPRLNKADFLSLNACSDVLLDNFEWSGCNSSLEGIGCSQVPVVTCPGKFMRGRHTFAMLNMMGITETIASDVNDFIDISVRLAKDELFYESTRQKIRNNYKKIYDDMSCVKALEESLIEICKNKI